MCIRDSYRAERKEQFEQLLRADRRKAYYTEFLPSDPDKADQDLRDVLAHGLMDEMCIRDRDQVWNRVTINRAAHKSTRYYIDEMHLLLKEEQTLSLIHI